jgi:hypothetical protein
MLCLISRILLPIHIAVKRYYNYLHLGLYYFLTHRTVLSIPVLQTLRIDGSPDMTDLFISKDI